MKNIEEIVYPISFCVSGYKWLYPDTCYLYPITHHMCIPYLICYCVKLWQVLSIVVKEFTLYSSHIMVWLKMFFFLN